MSVNQHRRSFFAAIGSLAGLGAIRASAQTASQTPAQPLARAAAPWDLTWLEAFKGRHKQIFDFGSFNLEEDPRPLRFVRNYLETFHDVFGLSHPDINTAVGISGPAFAINASDALWKKYKFGERWKIPDPQTSKPAVRNLFLDEATAGTGLSVPALQARGTVFWQCNVALGGLAAQLAQAFQAPVAEVRAELVAGLNPGVRLVPSHVMAVGLIQEHGFTYAKV